MADKWMPGVTRMPQGGGLMSGPDTVRACVWHTSEGPPTQRPADVARYVAARGSDYHLIWNPYSGEMVQAIPADLSSRALRNAPGLLTNRTGVVRIQVCAIGRAADAPLVNSPLKGWDRLRPWLASWGIPERDARDPSRSATTWRTASGHTTHSSAPAPNDHTDPGAMDLGLLFGQAVELTGEDTMMIVRQGTKSPLLIHGSATTIIDEKSARSIQEALEKGKASAKVTADVYQRLKAL